MKLLAEGGAAGHMFHPFDLSWVNNGNDLIDFFEIFVDNAECKIDNGTGISIIKIDPNVVNTGKTKTFNNRDLSVLNPYDNATQYTLDKVPATTAVRQAPFILGARGYGITRENDTAIVVDPGDKSNTDD